MVSSLLGECRYESDWNQCLRQICYEKLKERTESSIAEMGEVASIVPSHECGVLRRKREGRQGQQL